MTRRKKKRDNEKLVMVLSKTNGLDDKGIAAIEVSIADYVEVD